MNKKKKTWVIVLISVLAALMVMGLIVVLVIVLFLGRMSMFRPMANEQETSVVQEELEESEVPTDSEDESATEDESVTEDESANEDEAESQDDEDDRIPVAGADTTLCLNNGSEVVRYKDITYYRVRTIENTDCEGLWGDYVTVQGDAEIVGLNERGEEVVRFADQGYSDMFFYGNRMYSQYMPEDGTTIMYSCDLEGGDYKEYGAGKWAAIDPVIGVLYQHIYEPYGYLAAYSLLTETSTELDAGVGEVFGIYKGRVFYRSVVTEDEELYKIKCYDSETGEISEPVCMRESDVAFNEYESNYYLLQNIIFRKDMMYFAFGGYSGSGNFYDGGIIGRVPVDGGDCEILTPEGAAMETYYLYDDGTSSAVFYMDIAGNNEVIPLEGTIPTLEFTPVTQQNQPQYNYTSKEVFVLDGYEGSCTVLLSEKEITGFGLWYYYEDRDEEKRLTIDDVEQVDDWIYFNLYCSARDPENDIGWREAYRLEILRKYRKNIKTDEIQFLYASDVS